MLAIYIRRLGFALLFVAVGLYVIGLQSPASDTSHVRMFAILGGAVLGLSYLVEAVRSAGRRCPRCGKHAVAGSIFCLHHRDELTQTASRARSHRS